jgi:hypothetical protein
MTKLKDVFVPGGMPSYTYQDRNGVNLEASLKNAIHRVRKFIAVAGPTKSGKTVLTRKVVPPRDSIWIEGAHIASVDDFWSAALAGLGIVSPSGVSETTSREDLTETETSAGFKPAGVGVATKVKESAKESASTTRNGQMQSAKAQSAVAALLNSRKVVVIDDFH